MTNADIVEITVSQWNATNAATCTVGWVELVNNGNVNQYYFSTEAILFGPEIESNYPIQTIDKEYEDIGDRIPVIITTFDSRSRLSALEVELRRCLREYVGGSVYKYIHVDDLKETFTVQNLFKAEGNVLAQYPGKNV